MESFKIEGLEEFQEKLKTIEKKSPDRIINELDKQGNRLRRAVRENTPVRTGKLKRSYKLSPVEKVKGGYSKGFRSNAPHFHLVERGHMQVNRDGSKKWVEGIFMVEKTVMQEEDPIMKDLQKWMNTLFLELR